MAAVAELEAGLISKRTRDALAAAKARGKALGGYRGTKLTAAIRKAGRDALANRANERAADIESTIKDIQASGATSLRAIAAELNSRRVPTPRGDGEWSAVQVSRTIDRISAGPFEAASAGAHA